jgi:hypothetical protein
VNIEQVVWVITINHKYDYGIYRIYTKEADARVAYEHLVRSKEWGNPTLSKWKLDMPIKLKQGKKCFKQIAPQKRDDIPFSKYPWEE